MKLESLLASLMLAVFIPGAAAIAPTGALQGWTHSSPREEIAPAFAIEP